MDKKVHYLVVDTTAFIQSAPLQEIGINVVTCQSVVEEITNKRQLRRLVVLPYDLQVKQVDPECIQFVTEFSKKTGDYPSLSVTDIQVIALTYQLTKEHQDTDNLRTEPVVKSYQNVNIYERNKPIEVTNDNDDEGEGEWITPDNLKIMQKKLIENGLESDIETVLKVSCMTTDFSMQNVLKQINLNVSALDGRLIKEIRTFVLRCYACFKITSVMTHKFCPNCGNETLKKVATSINEEGQLQIHINARKPLTGRGKRYSCPLLKGGKHPNNPIIVADQPQPDNRPTRLAKTKNNPLQDEYIAGFSPFIIRDVNSKSAMLKIRPEREQYKHWMRKNPNEARRKRK